MPTTNKREFFRVQLQIPLNARFRIVGFQRVHLNSKISWIFIKDISAGGLRMHSKLDMPVHEELLLEFKLQLLHKEISLLGTVVRKSEIDKGIFEYGIRFSMDDSVREQLVSQLQLLSIRLKNQTVLASCSFTNEDEIEQFYLTDEAETVKI